MAEGKDAQSSPSVHLLPHGNGQLSGAALDSGALGGRDLSDDGGQLIGLFPAAPNLDHRLIRHVLVDGRQALIALGENNRAGGWGAATDATEEKSSDCCLDAAEVNGVRQVHKASLVLRRKVAVNGCHCGNIRHPQRDDGILGRRELEVVQPAHHRQVKGQNAGADEDRLVQADPPTQHLVQLPALHERSVKLEGGRLAPQQAKQAGHRLVKGARGGGTRSTR